MSLENGSIEYDDTEYDNGNYDVFDMRPDDYAGLIDRTGFDPHTIEQDRADQHLAMLDGRGQVRARCSIWWRDTARVDGQRSGAIGHYAANDEAAGRAALAAAGRMLHQHGCRIAVGPLDGNTWRRYRFVTERGDERPFFLEPDNPDEYPVHFARSDFRPLAHYVSEINPDIATRQPGIGTLSKKIAAAGVRIRSIDCRSPEDDLNGIHRVITESFKQSFLFTPLDRESFLALYAPLIRAIDPRLMLVACREGEIIGFVFAPPDVLQKKYRSEVDAIVLKTVAVLPQRSISGLGRLLIRRAMQNGVEMGYTRAISALMHEDNRSRSISVECAMPMRRYTLFARALSR